MVQTGPQSAESSSPWAGAYSRRSLGLRPAAILLIAFIVFAGGVAKADGLPAASQANFQVVVSATPFQGDVPLLVLFNASVTVGTPTLYEWSFGDGSNYSGANASAARPAHNYVVAGVYVVRVTVFEENISNSSSIAVSALPSPLSVVAHASVTSGLAPLTVTFTGDPTGGTGTYENFTWHFGDGGQGSGENVAYTYLEPGSYTATFTVYDSAAASATASVRVNVTGSANTGTSGSGAGWTSILTWALVGFAIGVGVALALVRLRFGPARYEGAKSTLDGTPVPPSTPTVSADTPGQSVIPATPAAPKSVPRPRQSGEGLLSISQRIVVHLSAQGQLRDDEVATPGFTQGGMASALGVRQNSLTNVLRRLVAAGLLTEDVRHVKGRNRRLKVYRLTVRGEGLARELRLRRKTSP